MIDETKFYHFLEIATQLPIDDLIQRQYDDDVIDSFTRIELAAIFEEELGVALSMAEIEKMTSVSATFSLLRSKME